MALHRLEVEHVDPHSDLRDRLQLWQACEDRLVDLLQGSDRQRVPGQELDQRVALEREALVVERDVLVARDRKEVAGDQAADPDTSSAGR